MFSLSFLRNKLSNGSSSESDPSNEEEYEDLPGTENGATSDEAVEEDKSKKKTTIKHKKQKKIKWEACQPPDALNIPLTETPVDIQLDEYSDIRIVKMTTFLKSKN